MNKKEKFEEIKPQFLGDRTLRMRRRKPRRKISMNPNVPGIIRFLRDVATKTPLIPLLLALVVFWLLASWGIYLVEHKINGQITSYSYALWWSFTAMQTQGANAPGPITAAGMTIGAVWSIFSTIAFFGVIIGTLYSYFILPRRNPSRELVSAIQYNLDEMEYLSIDELVILKETISKLVNARINHLKVNT